MSVRVLGMQEIIEKLSSVETKISKKIANQALDKALYPVIISAVRRVPFKSGVLFNSIGKTGTRTTRGQIRKSVFAKAPHAPLMEFGWWWTTHEGQRVRKVGPYPSGGFMRPALYENQDKILDILATELKAELGNL